jgi:hypothetical protein
MTTLSEKDFKVFKKWLKSHLAYGPTTVVFTKKDGTERTINCTTKPELVPVEPIVEGVEKKEKKINDEVMPVYDLDAKGWRSFRWDSIRAIQFSIGGE